jgi:hypothetical protein
MVIEGDGGRQRWQRQKETETADSAVTEGDREGVDCSEYAQRGHRWCGIIPEVMQPCEYSF